MFYDVSVYDDVNYFGVEADSPEEAEEIALGWFEERYHATTVKLSSKNDEE